MQTGNGNLVIADLVGSMTRHVRHLGTATGNVGSRKWLRGLNRGAQGTEITEAGGPSKFSMAIAVSVVQGMKLICAGGWEGVMRGRAGHMLHRKQAMAASISNQRRACLRLKNLEVDPQTQGDQQAGRGSQ
jgi:hypothetical protein